MVGVLSRNSTHLLRKVCMVLHLPLEDGENSACC
jgi:hypothetical protein